MGGYRDGKDGRGTIDEGMLARLAVTSCSKETQCSKKREGTPRPVGVKRAEKRKWYTKMGHVEETRGRESPTDLSTETLLALSNLFYSSLLNARS
jgi:hypothetical protein